MLCTSTRGSTVRMTVRIISATLYHQTSLLLQFETVDQRLGWTGRAIDIERVVDSQLSASSYTREPIMLRLSVTGVQ